MADAPRYTTDDLCRLIRDSSESVGAVHAAFAANARATPGQLDIALLLAGVHGIARRESASAARRALDDLSRAIEQSDEQTLAALTGRAPSSTAGNA